MKILVTGGAGFVGSHIVDALIEAGHRVIVVDDLRIKVPFIRKKAKLFPISLGAKELEDVFEKEKPEVIVHAAAQVSVPYSFAHPCEDAQNNICESLHLLELAKKYRITRFIYLSTGGAINAPSDLFPTPELQNPHPPTPYGISKYIFECYLAAASKKDDLPVAILRLANVYGPRQMGHGEAGVVAAFLAALKEGKSLTIFGDGSATRDFIYVKDIAQAVVKIVEKQLTGMANLSTGKETSIRMLADHLASLYQKPVEIHFEKGRTGDTPRSVLDPSKAKRLWGIRANTSLKDGLAETYAWFMKQKSL